MHRMRIGSGLIKTLMLKSGQKVSWRPQDILYAVLTATLLIAVGAGAIWVLSSRGGVPWSYAERALVILTLETTLLFPAWFWGPRKYGGGWATLGLRHFPLWKGLALGVVAVIAAAVASIRWDILRQARGLLSQPDLLPQLRSGLPSLLMMLFVIAVLSPIAEEVFFRGFLLAGLRAHLGWSAAVVISAALFSMAHLIPGSLPGIFMIGILFGLLYEFTDSIWPSVAMHGLLNAMAVTAIYILAQYPSLPR